MKNNLTTFTNRANSLDSWRNSWSPFEEFFTESRFTPACDVEETPTHHVLTLEMAGMKKDDIKIEFDHGVLSITGERNAETENKQDGLWYSERRYGKFHRSFTLPKEVDTDRIEAKYEDGLLRVAIPKTESAKPKTIRVLGKDEKLPV